MLIKDSGFYSNLSSEDKLLVSKILDWIDICESKYQPKFSFFLDERQCELIQGLLISLNCHNFCFYGGYNASTRKVLGIFPEYYEYEDNDFPIKAITFLYRKNDVLSHRDFLGCLMANQIKRETIGDIIVGEGETVVFFYNTVSDFIFNNILKIGSVGVVPLYQDNLIINSEIKFTEIKGTVASLRLDAISSLASKLSREKISNLIKGQGIDVNHVNIKNPSYNLKEADVFSIRGYGKFTFYKINGVSKKERFHITINKFI